MMREPYYTIVYRVLVTPDRARELLDQAAARCAIPPRVSIRWPADSACVELCFVELVASASLAYALHGSGAAIVDSPTAAPLALASARALLDTDSEWRPLAAYAA